MDILEWEEQFIRVNNLVNLDIFGIKGIHIQVSGLVPVGAHLQNVPQDIN